jgi:hypothetical protein
MSTPDEKAFAHRDRKRKLVQVETSRWGKHYVAEVCLVSFTGATGYGDTAEEARWSAERKWCQDKP